MYVQVFAKLDLLALLLPSVIVSTGHGLMALSSSFVQLVILPAVQLQVM